MEFSRVILRPMQTEKTYSMKSSNKAAFLVDPKATKHDIEIFISTVYGVSPIKITTQIRKPHKTKVATLHPGFTKMKKIAIVTFPADYKIDAEAAAENNVNLEGVTSAPVENTLKNSSKKEISVEGSETETVKETKKSSKKEIKIDEPSDEKGGEE
ncbi:MAG: 50S ribosomal protein L23 [Mycoplasmataceae bacterium]|jgi:large subunit ribosomal protein L23|nr:50S ribosomal protein L23 [Mycoplasmataceae bacterium]